MNKSLIVTTLLAVSLFACSKKEEAPAQAPAAESSLSSDVKAAATEAMDTAKEAAAATGDKVEETVKDAKEATENAAAPQQEQKN